MGGAFYEAHEGDIKAAPAKCMGGQALAEIIDMFVAWPVLPSLMLKVVHDHLKNNGVDVKNALATEWRTAIGNDRR